MSENIIILGTGAALVTKCYNTCFTISNNDEYLLVDTGGGNTILSNLEKVNIPLNRIHNVFISHSHSDHITGIVWVIRAIAQQIIDGNYEHYLYIYCHKDVVNIIKNICDLLLQNQFTKFIGTRIVFKEIIHNTSLKILDRKIKFFDIKSNKHLQFGFTMSLKSGKTLTFLGDEPYNNASFDYCSGVDYLIHEAYCLYNDRHIFNPYEKYHSTVKDASQNASRLMVKNLILIHTEDKNLPNRKKLYTEEGSHYFRGNIIVPDDLEIIKLI